MKNKDFDAVKEIRAMRDRNYKDTKNLSRKELLKRYEEKEKQL